MAHLKLKPVLDGHKKISVNDHFSKGNFLEMNSIAKKNLSSLIQGFSIKDIKGTLDREISSIAFDSRKIKKKSLFVAIPGLKENGFNFINDSISQGASAFITEESVEGLSNIELNQDNVTAICVEDCRKALAWIGSKFYNQPSNRIDLFGVTGTNGKTTTTYILDSIYKAQKKISGIIGTIHYGYAGTNHSAPITTPESLDINRMLDEMTEQKISQCFLEVSSHSLSLKRVHGMHFAVGVFTNLSRDHLDFHKTMDSYKEAKKGLFRDNFVEKAVTNIDDPVGLEIANEFCGDLLTTSIGRSADVVAENYKLSETGSSFTLKTPSGSCKIQTSLLGRHNIYNLISAASAALINGISLNDIAQGLRSIDQIPGRFEKVPCDKGFSVVVDYAHTDDALRSVLRAAQAFTSGRIITVFGCGGDRDRGKRKAMGRVAIEESGFSIITSDNPRTENPQYILDDILEGVPSSMDHGEDYKVIIDRKEAIRFAIKQARPGDLVMITGKGHENYQIVKTGKIHFDDREVAEEAIRRLS